MKNPEVESELISAILDAEPNAQLADFIFSQYYSVGYSVRPIDVSLGNSPIRRLNSILGSQLSVIRNLANVGMSAFTGVEEVPSQTRSLVRVPDNAPWFGKMLVSVINPANDPNLPRINMSAATLGACGEAERNFKDGAHKFASAGGAIPGYAGNVIIGEDGKSELFVKSHNFGNPTAIGLGQLSVGGVTFEPGMIYAPQFREGAGQTAYRRELKLSDLRALTPLRYSGFAPPPNEQVACIADRNPGISEEAVREIYDLDQIRDHLTSVPQAA